jgi:hypothetical protein
MVMLRFDEDASNTSMACWGVRLAADFVTQCDDLVDELEVRRTPMITCGLRGRAVWPLRSIVARHLVCR